MRDGVRLGNDVAGNQVRHGLVFIDDGEAQAGLFDGLDDRKCVPVVLAVVQ